MRIGHRVAWTLARQGWEEEALGCAVRRSVSYVQLPDPASVGECLAAVAEGIRVVRVVAGSREEEAGIVRAVVGLAVGTDRVAARAVAGYEAEVGRRHL